jgi:serine/threonine protein kinase
MGWTARREAAFNGAATAPRKGKPMASELPVTALVDLIRKSGVVEDKVLDTYLKKLAEKGPLPATAIDLARGLVRDGVLTKFQAEQLLQGRWRRFIIGKYKVLEPIGAGGMGSVFLCEHKAMRRRVAVKVLSGGKSKEPASLERFYREARAVAALDHPNIVHAYDIDQDGDLHFLVMEYIDGISLQRLVDKNGPLAIATAADYARQAALGLHHAHQKAGLVHRDVKPDNVLVDRRGVVKILDLGLARFFYDEADQLTRVYDEKVLGTSDYLAPEQLLDDRPVDIRADIYSLGATLYFCLTAKPLFGPGPAPIKRIWQQVRQPKPVRSLRPEVPEELARVMEKMIAKAPEQRYPTPLEVAEALAPWTQNPPIPPTF